MYIRMVEIELKFNSKRSVFSTNKRNLPAHFGAYSI